MNKLLTYRKLLSSIIFLCSVVNVFAGYPPGGFRERFDPKSDSIFLGNSFVPNQYFPNSFSGGFSKEPKLGMHFKRPFVFGGVFNFQRGFWFVDQYINQDFEGAIFEGEADFRYAIFKVYVSFQDAIFKGPAFFLTSFERGATFTNTTFENNAQLNGTMKGNIHFNLCNLGHFSSQNTVYKSGLDFIYSDIKTNAHFMSAQFYGKVSFDYSSVGRILDLSNSSFEHAPTFNNFFLPDTVHAENLRIKSNDFQNSGLDFRLSRVDSLDKRKTVKKCNIFLEGFELSKIMLPYTLFEIKFNPTTTFEMKCKIYEGVINTCKAQGMILSAEGWDTDYKRMVNLEKLGYFGYFTNFFNSIWWNFGYSKWRILVIWLPLLFVIFLGYNTWRLPILYQKMYNDTDLGSSFESSIKAKFYKEGLPNFKNKKFRFAFAFFYTATIYFGFKLKHDSVNYTYIRGLFYLYFMYSMGAIHMAFALSYILGIY